MLAECCLLVEKKLLNISLGLAAQILRFMQPGELRAGLATAGVTVMRRREPSEP